MIPISKPFIGEDEKQAVLKVLESGMLAQGSKVTELESKFANLCQVRHAIATSSGTTALHTALLAHGIGLGDEVITTPFTFIASANSILYTGGRPVFVDVEKDTFNIDAGKIEAAVTAKTKAILPVHLYGQVCNMEAILDIANRHGLAVIEDACQAVGATRNGKVAGSFGTGTFSLYATKNIMSAEGGMITTDDDHIADQCRLIRNHGMKRRYYYDMLGFNYRMTNVHAAIGLAQMNRYETLSLARQNNADFYNREIRSVIKPVVKSGNKHVWHQYTIRIDGRRDRDEAVERLNEMGIGTGIFYPIPVHQHDYMREIVGDISLPVAEQLAREVISIPVHPLLSQDDLTSVVNGVNSL